MIRVDCKSSKDVLEKDVQNIASKQIFARWQTILSIFYFEIAFIKGSDNHIPDFLTREFLQGTTTSTSCPVHPKGEIPENQKLQHPLQSRKNLLSQNQT